MNAIMKPLAFVVTCAVIGGCAKGPARATPDPAVVAARKAKTEAIIQTAKPVEFQGARFLVGQSPDKTYALVDFSSVDRVSGALLEQVASRGTGCDAVFEGGVLKLVPGITNMTALPITGTKRLRVETYCAGDTRNRVSGLTDAMPGSDAHAARFSNYPQVGRTYLSFDRQHGFQVSFYETGGRSWLWYPGNGRSLPEDWKLSGRDICFRHPNNTYNPATKKSGGSFQCQPLDLSRRTTVAELNGDPFGLATGRVPYRLEKCDAPKEFSFEREQYQC